MYYICIDSINGRKDFFDLATKLFDRGYDDRVEYCAGYVDDDTGEFIRSHLRFLDDNDALAYVISYGGEILTQVPVFSRATKDCS